MKVRTFLVLIWIILINWSDFKDKEKLKLSLSIWIGLEMQLFCNQWKIYLFKKKKILIMDQRSCQ